MNTRAAVGALIPVAIGLLLAACAEPEQRQEAEVDLPEVEEGYFPGADGVRLFYRRVGAGPETAVYLHGGPFSMADGGYELDQLADGRALIAFDQRSGGKSDLVYVISLNNPLFQNVLEQGHSYFLELIPVYREKIVNLNKIVVPIYIKDKKESSL